MIHAITLRPWIRKIAKPITVFASFTLLSATAQAPLDVRVALVVGNATYSGDMALTNPANDAAAMSGALKNLGFTVIEIRNASRAQMEDGVKKLFVALKGKQGVGMLYYAGHGLQIDWKNYMVPVDAKLQTAKDVPGQTLDVADVLDALKAAGSRMNVVVLDACRDNPFAEKGGKGLAPVDAPPGTFLAFATSPGNVAEDGIGSNGLYTKHLLAELQKPVSIENVFKRVRLNVRKESNGRQIPWESTSLEDDFSFAANRQVASVSRGAQRDADFVEQKAQWDKIKDLESVDALYDFLVKYPSGLIAEVAQAKLERLSKTSVTQQFGKTEPIQNLVGDKLKIGDSWTVRHTSRFKGFFGGMSEDVRSFNYRVASQQGEVYEIIQRGGFVDSAKTFWTGRGAVVRYEGLMSATREFDPPLPKLPLGIFKIGDSSISRSTLILNGKKLGDFESEIKVLGRESLTTPAGTFDTYKIERNATELTIGGDVMKIKWIAWYAPNILVPLKEVDERSNGEVFTFEVTNFKAGS
jgi:hypothetical protein